MSIFSLRYTDRTKHNLNEVPKSMVLENKKRSFLSCIKETTKTNQAKTRGNNVSPYEENESSILI